jgi:hypothetical protein
MATTVRDNRRNRLDLLSGSAVCDLTGAFM